MRKGEGSPASGGLGNGDDDDDDDVGVAGDVDINEVVTDLSSHSEGSLRSTSDTRAIRDAIAAVDGEEDDDIDDDVDDADDVDRAKRLEAVSSSSSVAPVCPTPASRTGGKEALISTHTGAASCPRYHVGSFSG